MRLLDLEDCDLEAGHLSLRTFSGTDIPGYAILSHRWTDDEVLFKDVENGTSAERNGYFKLRGAINQARADGFAYLWDDTCCIDKSSSAELSEAINSMWVWYRDAPICYAYLDDVSANLEDADFEAHFKSSAWFTRGWTLQELIAPRYVNFYNASWTPIGTKQILQRAISETTGIDDDYLNHIRPLSAASTAKRMSWAAHRKTTRLEDTAYCLMGLFSVNMPMLYGEGSRAFHRLQEEILRISDDESIFAWVEENAKSDVLHGLLADSPLQFKDSGNIGPLSNARKPLQTTNLGLNIQRSLDVDRMPLLCNYRGLAGYLCVIIVPVGDVYARRCLAELPACMYADKNGSLCFPQIIPHPDRFLPKEETVLQYMCYASDRMMKNRSYERDSELSNLHPMSGGPLNWQQPLSFYSLPKFGTYQDLNIQFRIPGENTYVLVIIGIVNSKELSFAADIGSSDFAHRLPESPEEYKGMIAAQNVFAKSAVPVGSSYDVAGLHRVCVRETPADVEHCGPAKSHRQLRRLEIDITSLAYTTQPPPKPLDLLSAIYCTTMYWTK